LIKFAAPDFVLDSVGLLLRRFCEVDVFVLIDDKDARRADRSTRDWESNSDWKLTMGDGGAAGPQGIFLRLSVCFNVDESPGKVSVAGRRVVP